MKNSMMQKKYISQLGEKIGNFGKIYDFPN